MKPRMLLICLLLLFPLMYGCKEDSAEPETPANTLVYDGKNFSITQTGIQDYNEKSNYPSHYYYKFILTDGKLSLYDNNSAIGTQGTSFFMTLHLFSPGTERFKPGTFHYVNVEGLPLSQVNDQVKDKFFFDNGNFSMPIEEDDNNPYTPQEYELSKATSGTVKVSGTANPYTVEIDLKMDNGKKLRGKYSGDFIVKTIELD